MRLGVRDEDVSRAVAGEVFQDQEAGGDASRAASVVPTWPATPANVVTTPVAVTT